MKGTDENQPLSKISPFAIAKGITGIADKYVKIKRLQDGNLLLECNKRSQSENLLRSTVLALAPVSVSPHVTLNSCKGVVRDKELAAVSEEEIKEHLPFVTSVRHMTRKQGNKTVTTNTMIMTFDLPKIPSHIYCGYYSVPVSQYIPSPMRCFKCQKFGHTTMKCNNDVVCVRCSDDHNDQDCSKALKCANCKGDHAANSKDCARWKREYDIQCIKVNQQLSFFEARKKYESLHGHENMNFARATKMGVGVASVGTQTDAATQTDDILTSKAAHVSVAKTVAVNTAGKPPVVRAVTKQVAGTSAAKPQATVKSVVKPKTVTLTAVNQKKTSKSDVPQIAHKEVVSPTTRASLSKATKGKEGDKSFSQTIKNPKLSQPLMKRGYQAADFLKSDTPVKELNTKKSKKKEKIAYNVVVRNSLHDMISEKREKSDNPFKPLRDLNEEVAMDSSSTPSHSVSPENIKGSTSRFIKLPI